SSLSLLAALSFAVSLCQLCTLQRATFVGGFRGLDRPKSKSTLRRVKVFDFPFLGGEPEPDPTEQGTRSAREADEDSAR
ncbi:unnamed protein product, partial [Symbiodinium pilosum]